MKIGLISAKLPPAIDGVGDYTDRLARALGQAGAEVIIYSGAPARDGGPYAVRKSFTVGDLASFRKLGPAIARDRLEWVVLQYSPFSFGRWGLNPLLPLTLACTSGLRVATMVHEPFVPVVGAKSLALSALQRSQLAAVAAASERLFFSIEPWRKRFAGWFGEGKCFHLPVGSNVDFSERDPRNRERIGAHAEDLLAGVFGTDHPSRPRRFLLEAIERLADRGFPIRVLSIGSMGPVLRESLRPNLRDRVIDLGILDAAAAGRAFSAMDLYLSPYVDGASTRRSALMPGFQHGIATVTTTGEWTDPQLRREVGKSFLAAPAESSARFADLVLELAGDAELRARVGQAGAELYRRNFDWPVITSKLLKNLKMGQ